MIRYATARAFKLAAGAYARRRPKASPASRVAHETPNEG
jgi:hypothetical protein